MHIAWTTVAHRSDADEMAACVIGLGLAACVQVEGPIVSVYRWNGQVQQVQEFRLCLKFTPGQAAALSDWIHGHHPYDTPEWIVVRASDVGEKYLSWAGTTSSNPPL